MPGMDAVDDPPHPVEPTSKPVDQGDHSKAGPPWHSRTYNNYPLDICVSGLQKAIRRGREHEALFWGHEMYGHPQARANYHAHFWRRICIIASEECASDPMAVVFTASCLETAMFASGNGKNRIEGVIEAHAILFLCRSVKSREACDAAMLVQNRKKHGWRIKPHDAAVDKHTAAGRAKGRNGSHFRHHGRLVAGQLGRNDYEAPKWGGNQDHLPRPEEPGGEPDVEIPGPSEET